MVKLHECGRSGQHYTDAGDLGPALVDFAQHLSGLGYARLTVTGFHASARHFAQWLVLTNVAVSDINDAVIDSFAQHRCRCLGARRAKSVSSEYVNRVRRFVEFLIESGTVPREAKRTARTCDRRVAEFQGWLRQHRGICEKTIDRHGRMVMRLLPVLGKKPRSYNAHLIRMAIVTETKRSSVTYVKTMTTALRGYLRFLGAQGLCRPGLDHAVPTVPQWRLSALPRYIPSSDVERLIATCDATTPVGIRNRAILLLLARLGLRSGDILSLRLNDIDWQQATLSVRGKGRRETKLPLPQDAGDAVLAYLDRVRPRVDSDQIFFMSKAPVRPMIRSTAVCGIVRRAIRNAGVAAPSMGANLLRHSAATAMLRGGATLDAVGAVLRHRSPNTTAHYAKVDVMMLQSVAQPWPGDAQC